MERARTLARLRDDTFEVLVIGGVTGAGAALDAGPPTLRPRRRSPLQGVLIGTPDGRGVVTWATSVTEVALLANCERGGTEIRALPLTGQRSQLANAPAVAPAQLASTRAQAFSAGPKMWLSTPGTSSTIASSTSIE